MLAVRCGDDPITVVALTGGDVDDPQGAPADVGDPVAGRADTWVHHGPGRGQFAWSAGTVGQIHVEEPPGQGEDGTIQRAVHGVGHDAATVLTKPFTTGPFLGGQVLVVGAERTRVGDHLGVTVRGVVQPQTGGLVEAVASSEERHPGPVRGDLEGAWNTQGEALGSGLLVRKAHKAIVSHAARATSSLPGHALGKQGENHRWERYRSPGD